MRCFHLLAEKYSDDASFQCIRLAASTSDFGIAKLIEAYQLPPPDFILSIQTGDDYGDGTTRGTSCIQKELDGDNGNDAASKKAGIQVKTEHDIRRGLIAIAKNTRTSSTETFFLNPDV